jgi:hypothetical protein
MRAIIQQQRAWFVPRGPLRSPQSDESGGEEVGSYTTQSLASIDDARFRESSVRRRRRAIGATSSTLVCTDWQQFLADFAVQLPSAPQR